MWGVRITKITALRTSQWSQKPRIHNSTSIRAQLHLIQHNIGNGYQGFTRLVVVLAARCHSTTPPPSSMAVTRVLKNQSKQKKILWLGCDLKPFVNSVSVSAKGFKGTIAYYSYSIKTKWGSKAYCKHEVLQRFIGRECGGRGLLCPHNRRKYDCKPCGGGVWCTHGILKRYCNDYNGRGLCKHGARPSTLARFVVARHIVSMTNKRVVVKFVMAREFVNMTKKNVIARFVVVVDHVIIHLMITCSQNLYTIITPPNAYIFMHLHTLPLRCQISTVGHHQGHRLPLPQSTSFAVW